VYQHLGLNGHQKHQPINELAVLVEQHLDIVCLFTNESIFINSFLSGYRLYSSAVFNDSFIDYTSPEIVRKPVEDLVLQLKTLNIDRLANFPFPTPPDLKAINVAEKILVQLNALDGTSSTRKITELGRRMSAFPLNPRYSKMLVIAQENQELLPYVIALVAALSVNEILTNGQVMIQKVRGFYFLIKE
jgi:HrpA-like RNA helicase